MFDSRWQSRSYEVALPKQFEGPAHGALGRLAISAGELVRQAGSHLALSHVPTAASVIPQRVQAERADDGGWVFVASLARPKRAPYWLVDYAAFSLEPAAPGWQLVLGDLRVDQRYHGTQTSVERPPTEQLDATRVLSALALGFESLVGDVLEQELAS